jgi:hypothetical protein
MESHPDYPELLRAVVANIPAYVRGDVPPERLVSEMTRYLALRVVHPTEALSPSPLLDLVWHECMLIPMLYYATCEALRARHRAPAPAGAAVLVPHSTLGAEDPDPVRRARYERTLALYAQVFAEEPREDCWDPWYGRDFPVGRASPVDD